MAEQVHVVPHEGSWAVRVANRDRANSTFNTKEAAIRAGRTLAESLKAELKIHNQDGTISESDSHGNDPRSIPG